MSGELRVTLEDVCTLPQGCEVGAVTADGHVVGWCATSDGRDRFLWDRHLGEPYDGIVAFRDRRATYVSADGTHVAYIAGRGGKEFVGRDDAEDPPVIRVSGSVRPTFGGPHLAYGAEVAGGDYELILDGRSIATALAAIAVAFSPDGSRLAYVQKRGGHRGPGSHCVVVDGEAGEWFDGMRNAPNAMQFSPDGRRFAYYALDADGGARWVVDGVPQLETNDAPLEPAQDRGGGPVPPLLACFSPDGRRFAYSAEVNNQSVSIVEDRVPGPLFRAVAAPVFSPDSRHLAYVAQGHGGEVNLVLDGSPIGVWPGGGTSQPVFSADGRHVALSLCFAEGRLFRKRGRCTVALDGRLFPQERADGMGSVPWFSPDGSRLAWWLQRGDDQVLVLDGIVRNEWPMLLKEPRFDALDRLVYAGWTKAGQTIMVDDRPGPMADAVQGLMPASEVFGPERDTSPVPFRLSPDGLHVAWAGRFGDEVRPVLDDEIGPGFDEIYECAFDAEGVARWWARRADTVLLARQET